MWEDSISDYVAECTIYESYGPEPVPMEVNDSFAIVFSFSRMWFYDSRVSFALINLLSR